MNLLPVLLIALLFGGEKLSSLKDFLAKIDFESFSPILKTFGIKDDIIKFLTSEAFSSMLNGQGDFKSLLQILAQFFKREENKTSDAENDLNDEDENDIPTDFISPIKSVAPTDIEETLTSYFS